MSEDWSRVEGVGAFYGFMIRDRENRNRVSGNVRLQLGGCTIDETSGNAVHSGGRHGLVGRAVQLWSIQVSPAELIRSQRLVNTDERHRG